MGSNQHRIATGARAASGVGRWCALEGAPRERSAAGGSRDPAAAESYGRRAAAIDGPGSRGESRPGGGVEGDRRSGGTRSGDDGGQCGAAHGAVHSRSAARNRVAARTERTVGDSGGRIATAGDHAQPASSRARRVPHAATGRHAADDRLRGLVRDGPALTTLLLVAKHVDRVVTRGAARGDVAG